MKHLAGVLLLLWALLARAATPEALLLESLDALRAGQVDQALRLAGQLRERWPDYRLGQLLWLQLNAHLGGDGQVLYKLHAWHRDEYRQLMTEAGVRWRHATSARAPETWVRDWILHPGGQPWWVVVDLSGSRLYLFRNESGRLTKVFDTYVSMGQRGYGKAYEGDRRTPVGIYRIVEWIPGEKLPPLYGAGALPLDYPNPWDRMKGRTGSGIWLHGTPPDTWSRPPRSSRGCVVMSNDGVRQLRERFRLPMGTPVLLVDRLQGYPPLQGIERIWPANMLAARYPGEPRLVWTLNPDGSQAFWQADGEGGWQLALQAPPQLAEGGSP